MYGDWDSLLFIKLMKILDIDQRQIKLYPEETEFL